jgi:mycothiol synthase
MGQTVPVGFKVRRACLADATAVTALVATSQEALHGRVDISRASVLRKWRAPHFDLAQDSWLIEADAGRVVAIGAVRQSIPGREFEGNLTVHPDYYGRGLGMFLLGQVEEAVRTALEAAAQPFAVLRTWSSSANAAECELYLASDFQRAAVFLHMEKNLDTELETPDWPADIRPRPFRRGDDDLAVYTALIEAFGDDPEDFAHTPEEWSRDVVDDTRTDPSLWLLACEGDLVVGAALGSLVNGRGFIERLAVRPAWQGRGIGGALLREAFLLLCSRGASKAILAVGLGVAVETLALYRRAGMDEVRRIEFFEKRIALSVDA